MSTTSAAQEPAASVSNVSKDTIMPILTKYEDLKEYIGKDVVLEGILKMEKFVNKGGREYEFYEFWLEMNDGREVMLRNKGEAMSKEPFTHKVHIEGNLFYGNVDSDNPEAQSRHGYRLDFTKITIVERR